MARPYELNLSVAKVNLSDGEVAIATSTDENMHLVIQESFGDA